MPKKKRKVVSGPPVEVGSPTWWRRQVPKLLSAFPGSKVYDFRRYNKTYPQLHLKEIAVGFSEPKKRKKRKRSSSASEPQPSHTSQPPGRTPDVAQRPARTVWVEGLPEGFSAQEWRDEIADLIDRSDPEGKYH